MPKSKPIKKTVKEIPLKTDSDDYEPAESDAEIIRWIERQCGNYF